MRPRTYIHVLINSFINASYYKSLLSVPLSFSVRFFLISIIFIGVISGGIATYKDTNSWKKYIGEGQRELVTHFPDDLRFSWSGSTLTGSEPNTVVGYPSFIDSKAQELPPNLALIDLSRNEPDTSTQEALVLITSKFLSVQIGDEYWQTLELQAVLGQSPLEITADSIDSQSAEVINNHLPTLMFVFGIASVLLFVISLAISRFFTAMFESLLLYLFTQALGKKYTYTQILALSLHVLIPAEVVQQVALIVIPASTIPFFSISFWTLMGFVLLSI